MRNTPKITDLCFKHFFVDFDRQGFVFIAPMHGRIQGYAAAAATAASARGEQRLAFLKNQLVFRTLANKGLPNITCR